MPRSSCRRSGGALLCLLLLAPGCRAGSTDAGRVGAEPRPGHAGPGAGPSDDGRGVGMERAWPVMGTRLRVTAWGRDTATVRGALGAARGAVLRVDSLMSTYRSDSEISALNRRAGTGAWTPVSAGTARVLEASLAWARRSGGAFDPTVGPLLEAWGFRRGTPSPPGDRAAVTARAAVGFGALRLEASGGELRARLERRGMALDLGAIAKGYALDRAVAAMRAEGAAAGMADLGGNVSVFGAPPDGADGWCLGVRHPRRAGGLLGAVEVRGGSVSTSGDYEQFVEIDGIRYAHVLDPRSGRPVRGIASVTVAAGDGITADALSTLLFVLGPEEGRTFLDRHPEAGPVAVLWVRDPGRGPLRRGHVTAWEAPGAGRLQVFLLGEPHGS